MSEPADPVRGVRAPEGVGLAFAPAPAAERALAFACDVAILVLIALAIVLLTIPFLSGGGFAVAFVIVLTFLLRTFYFIWFEVRWQGATPGKRRLHLRVIRADGGPLAVEALLTRNFTREVEFFLPLGFLLAPDMFWPGQPGWVKLLAGAWIVLLLLFPLCNPGRRRLGDLVAGTCVVTMPHAVLLGDLAAARRRPQLADAEDAAVVFTARQLGIYGIYELQVLEEVLRKARAPGGDEALTAVADRIRAKIGWAPPGPQTPTPEQFLTAFYAAQRKHLEQKLLLGERKERKEPEQPRLRPRPPRDGKRH